MTKLRLFALQLMLLSCACGNPAPDTATQDGTDEAAADCPPTVRAAVEQLGNRMRMVSLLAPDSVVARAIADAYAEFVTAELLAEWQASPRRAPGREVSNPWPARIDIRSITRSDGAECVVEGDVVQVTTTDTINGVERRAVRLRARERDGWRISSYEVLERDTAAETPRGVVQRYYDAIGRGDYPAAYALWGDEGRASGQSPQEFAAGFAATELVEVTFTDSVAMEGAAGSQYATVPVTIDAALRDGRRQQFEGTYTLRRSVVDGAREDQRRWRIFSADIREK